MFDGTDLSRLDDEGRRELNGRRIAMIFQDPLAYLNPVYTVGRQIAEVFESHGEGEGGAVRDRSFGCSNGSEFPNRTSGSTITRTSSRADRGSA